MAYSLPRSLCLIACASALGCAPPVRGAIPTVPVEERDPSAPGPIRTQPEDAPPPAVPTTSRSVLAANDDARNQALGVHFPEEAELQRDSEEARVEGERVERERAVQERRAGRQHSERLDRERGRRARDHQEALAARQKAWAEERETRIEELVTEARARAAEGAQTPRAAAVELTGVLQTRAVTWRGRATQARADAQEAQRKAEAYLAGGLRSAAAEKTARDADRKAYQLDLLSAQAEVEADWAAEAGRRVTANRE